MKDTNSREWLFHFIDWTLAIVALFDPSLQVHWLSIIAIATLFSVVLFLYFRNKHIKNQLASHVSQLESYKLLFDFPVPLYGVLAYLNRQSKRSESYHNDKIHLNKLTLCVQLVGKIQRDKNNDLKFMWGFQGTNISDTDDVGELYLNIGGDSAQKMSDLYIQCVDCAVNQESCRYNSKISDCDFEDECISKHLLTPHPVNVSTGVSSESNTSYLLNIPLAQKVPPHNDIKVKCEYTWPQCYNKYSDYLHIDPSNFAGKIDTIRIRIMLDEIVIKAETKVQIYSIDKLSNRIASECMASIDPTSTFFEQEFPSNNNKMYIIVIYNN